MFDIGWGELLLIGIVALIAIGPKELPGALRTLGQWMAKIRRMANEFQNQFHEAIREAELADLKKDVDDMAAQAQSYAHFDPLSDIQKDIEKAAGPPPSLDTPLDAPAGTTRPLETPVDAATANATPQTVADAPQTSEPAAHEPMAHEQAAQPAETPKETAEGAKPDAGRAA